MGNTLINPNVSGLKGPTASPPISRERKRGNFNIKKKASAYTCCVSSLACIPASTASSVRILVKYSDPAYFTASRPLSSNTAAVPGAAAKAKITYCTCQSTAFSAAWIVSRISLTGWRAGGLGEVPTLGSYPDGTLCPRTPLTPESELQRANRTSGALQHAQPPPFHPRDRTGTMPLAGGCCRNGRKRGGSPLPPLSYSVLEHLQKRCNLLNPEEA